MKKSYLTNIILLLLVIGLYWFINHQPAQVESNRLSTLHAKNVDTIKIQRHNRDDIILNKKSGHWFITQPIQANANSTRINLILALLSSRSHSQLKLAPSLSLQQFDLAPAKISLSINDQKFEFGNVESINQYRYIRYNNSIHLIDDTVAPLLNSNVASFINNRLFSEELSITSLNLPEIASQEGQSSALSINLENGHWQSSNETLSPDQLSNLVTAWQHAYAIQVFPLTADKIQKAIGQNITVKFSNQASAQLLLQFNSYGMSLIDPAKKLKYQFPLSTTQQFFLVQNQDTIH